jgi:hypothetical protein
MKNISLKYGLFGALAVFVYFYIIYTVNKELFLNPVAQWSSMVIYIALMLKASLDDVASHGSNRDFREIVRTPFTVFILINLGYWMFYYGLHLADPELLSMELSQQLAFLKKQLTNGTGDPEQAAKIREQIQSLESTKDLKQPLGPVLLQMAIGALGGFALSAGIASAMRFKQND